MSSSVIKSTAGRCLVIFMIQMGKPTQQSVNRANRKLNATEITSTFDPYSKNYNFSNIYARLC